MNPASNRINKYLPAAVLYFFLNSLLLPVGVLYTTLLTPLLLIWVIRYRNVIRYLLIYFLLVTPFVVAHWIDGIEDKTFYLQSIILSFTVFVFCAAFYQYLSQCHSLRDIYKKILLLNALMVLVSLIFLFIPAVRAVFWYDKTLSPGQHYIQRLKMLTYEPSYYSTLFAPIAIYYLLKACRNELPQPIACCTLVLIPLFLSLSFGVILGIALSFLVLLVLHSRRIFRSGYVRYVIGGAVLSAAVLGFFFVFFPDNVFFRRLQNIIAGNDTSFNGRTFDSFMLSIDIAHRKSLIWGAGFGQVKVLGLGLFRDFYNNGGFTVHDVVIPNSIGDLLGTLGLLGVGIKLSLEIWLFFKTRVFSNYYRLALFVFIFVYQFTGSFIMNIAEYAIWILAFKPDLFPEFDKI